LPEILAWSIEGWRRLRKRGRFAPPATSNEAVEALADLASPVAGWMRERAQVGDGFKVKCDVAYLDFRSWCSRAGMNAILTKAVFGRDLKAACGCDSKQVTEGDKRPWHYLGLRLAE
jgi:phage/plasmid-associated DNA primase